MSNPLEFFFKLGDKVTKGDVNRQQDFIYYMVWILFIAFLWLFVHNAYQLFAHGDLNAATWTLVGFAICGIQYFSLKGLYEAKKMRQQAFVKKEELEVESVEDMMEQFINKEKEEKNHVRNKSKKEKS